MSKIKLILSALAVVVGIGGAIAANTMDASTAWYFVNASGNPTSENVNELPCEDDSQVCQKQYYVDPQTGQRLGETGMTKIGKIHQ